MNHANRKEAALAAVETPRRLVSKTVGGISFDDFYDWLSADNTEALQWQQQQVAEAVAFARSVPFFKDLVDAIKPLLPDSLSWVGAKTEVGGRWFWTGRNDAGTALALRTSRDRDEDGEVLLDAAQLSTERGDDLPTTLSRPIPSPDGRWVAVAVTAGATGTASSVELPILDPTRPGHIEARIPVSPGSGGPGWLPDGRGLFISGRAEDGSHTLSFHAIDGHRQSPSFTFPLTDLPTTVPGIIPQVSPGGTHVLALSGLHEHVAAMIGDLRTGGQRPFRPADFDGELYGDWLDDDTYVAIATDEPHGRVVAIPVATSTDTSTWRELVPAGELVLRALHVVRGHLVVSALHDVALDIRVYTTDGQLVGVAPLPPASSSLDLTGPYRLRSTADSFCFPANSFTMADTTYELDVETLDLHVIEAGQRLDGVAIERYFATSVDGTQIPYFVVSRDDLDRAEPHPTLVNAYGGFNFPFVPTFLAENTPFVQAGGYYVRANLRGGSEYGRRWFEAGRLHHKLRTFDDLRAVAEDLVTRGFASSDMLAFQGTSHGGLLAGVAVVLQPELWRVVVPIVPMLDVIELAPPGPIGDMIRSTAREEYGLADNPEDAKVLFSYSPYHNVRDGVAYPAVFQVICEKDLACPPRGGRRFTAALQHCSTSGRPVLLRVWDGLGHLRDDPEIDSELHAEWLAFVMHELGMHNSARH